jgi:predicted Zn-dependent protease
MKKLILCLSIITVWTGCARNPVTGKREIVLVSENQEIAMGAQADQQAIAEYGSVKNENLQRYVAQVGNKLALVSHRSNLAWHFTVVDSPVINAFALPGGYVYVTRGILAYLNNEAELAGVVGHEIGHVTARHSVRQMTRAQLAQLGLGVGSVLSPTFGQLGSAAETGLGLLFLRFSRDDERQADSLGVEYAARGAYDPREVSNFFQVLAGLSGAADRETIPGWLSTHPDPPERVQATRTLAEQWIENLNLTQERMAVNRDSHVRNLDGLVFGDNPREGFLEGNCFYHPELQFQIAFPPGWHVENTRSAIVALDRGNAAQLQVTVPRVPEGTPAESFARRVASRDVVPQSGAIVDINGNRAFIGTYLLRTTNGPLAALAAFIEYRRHIFQIVGITTDFRRYREPFEQSIRSFEQVTDPRVLHAQPDRLKVYIAQQNDTLASIASRLNNPRMDADHLAILNRLAVDQPITPRRLIKTVERGY